MNTYKTSRSTRHVLQDSMSGTITLSKVLLALLFVTIVAGHARQVTTLEPYSPLVHAAEGAGITAVQSTPAPQSPSLPLSGVPAAETEKSEKQLIGEYIIKKFGDRFPDAIVMIRTCENSSLNPRRMSGLNVQKDGRESYDVGVFQINVDASNTAEIEHLKNWKYNIDQAYKKYHAKNDTFYLWTCGHVVNDRTYVDALKGKSK